MKTQITVDFFRDDLTTKLDSALACVDFLPPIGSRFCLNLKGRLFMGTVFDIICVAKDLGSNYTISVQLNK